MSDAPTYLDLDALTTNAPEVGFKLDGVLHRMVPVTVDGFVENLRLVQGLQSYIASTADTIVEPAELAARQIDVSVKTLVRAYPSVSEERLRQIPMEHLNAIVAYTQKLDGTDSAKQEAAREALENPLLGLSSDPTTA